MSQEETLCKNPEQTETVSPTLCLDCGNQDQTTEDRFDFYGVPTGRRCDTCQARSGYRSDDYLTDTDEELGDL